MEKDFGITGFVENENYQWENVGEGVKRKILGYDKDLMLVLVEFDKGAVGYAHKHPHKQISYIVKGSFEVEIEGQKKVLKAGDVFFVQPNLNHSVVALEDSALIDVFNPYREDFIKQ
ncbi:cupin domain-containing protein [Melioribacter sp. Ez-97]|uniref:cupin domain-containing protein n=1 Tax=Melioribacter sp. Ez-97 TaxID=3423434 RepID=UPI003ED8D27D